MAKQETKKPGRIWVQDETYVATVLKINSWYPDKTPRGLTLIKDEDTVHLKGGEQFMIVYALKEMKEPVGG